MRNRIPFLIFVLQCGLLVSLGRAADGADWSARLQGEWSVKPSGSDEVSAIMRFDADGDVVNTITDAFGHYYLLSDDRLLIEFTDSLILGELKQEGEIIMMRGYIGAAQPMNLVLSHSDEAATAAAEELQKKRLAMQKQYQAEVIKRAITHNLRQFASAAQQHMLDAGVSEVSYEDIVGEGKLIETLQVINGEDYSGLTLSVDDVSVSVTDSDGNLVTYEF